MKLQAAKVQGVKRTWIVRKPSGNFWAVEINVNKGIHMVDLDDFSSEEWEIIGEACRHTKREGATFSGWIVAVGNNRSDPIANKEAALVELRAALRERAQRRADSVDDLLSRMERDLKSLLRDKVANRSALLDLHEKALNIAISQGRIERTQRPNAQYYWRMSVRASEAGDRAAHDRYYALFEKWTDRLSVSWDRHKRAIRIYTAANAAWREAMGFNEEKVA